MIDRLQVSKSGISFFLGLSLSFTLRYACVYRSPPSPHLSADDIGRVIKEGAKELRGIVLRRALRPLLPAALNVAAHVCDVRLQEDLRALDALQHLH